jgi:thioredoxin 1
MIAPVIESLAQDYTGKIVFTKLDVDKNPQISSQYQIQSIPTLLIFKHGRLVDRLVGALPRQLLEPKIIQHLK